MPGTGRVVSVVVLLAIGAGLALLAVLVHYEFMRIYGDVSDTAFEGLTWGLTAGPSGLAFGLVAIVALATLIGYHALRSAQVRALLLTDVRDGRIHLPGRTVLLAAHVRQSLSAWLDYRYTRWPETMNPHLFINKQSAVRTTQVSHVWLNSILGMPTQALREDRILDEALATQDIRRLCDLFGLSVKGAERYLSTLDQPSLLARSRTTL